MAGDCPMTSGKRRILVAGRMASSPGQGGATWAVLQYLLGLSRLGHEVYFVEQLSDDVLPESPTLSTSAIARYFRTIVSDWELSNRAALWRVGTTETVGMEYSRLCAVAGEVDLLINLSGALRDRTLMDRIPVRAYVDLDPAFTQLWQAHDGIDMGFSGHTHFATVGQAIGAEGNRIPTCGLEWIGMVPPVVLDLWPVARRTVRHAFTTVGNWRGYGSIWVGETHYGQKAHSLRPFITLPRDVGVPFVLALGIHPAEIADLEALAANRWSILDPLKVAGTPRAYRRFVAGSWAEFGIAKSGYVLSRSGWLSDRSVCYLASGRPALVQDTGIGAFLPIGEGLLPFTTYEDVIEASERLVRDYARHRRAARALAEEFFDSARVLSQFIRDVGA
jgi:hypothetical protein